MYNSLVPRVQNVHSSILTTISLDKTPTVGKIEQLVICKDKIKILLNKGNLFFYILVPFTFHKILKNCLQKTRSYKSDTDQLFSNLYWCDALAFFVKLFTVHNL